MNSLPMTDDLRAEAARKLYRDHDIGELLRCVYTTLRRPRLTGLGLNRLDESRRMDAIRSWDMVAIVGLYNHSSEGRRLAQRTLREQLQSVVLRIADDAEDFIGVMDVTGTIISGSNALRFADRQAVWVPNDIDFYCTPRGFRIFCTYLEEYLGAVLIDEKINKQGAYSFNGFAQRRRYKAPMATVDVMCSTTSSALYPLTFFHSTLVMNALSANSICIAYPKDVAERTGTRSIYGLGSCGDAAVEKYESRGYQLLSTLFQKGAEEDAEEEKCSDRHRYFGDIHCLTIPFTPEMRPRVRQRGPVGRTKWTAGWSLGGPSCDNVLCDDCSGPESYPAVYVSM